MKVELLPKTSVEILAYLASRLRESFTVRQIADGIKKDYRITHAMTMRLAQQGYVIAEKKRPVTSCRLNLKDNSALLAYIEGVRASRFLARHHEIGILGRNILEKTSSPFFTMIIFGSHVKGTASKRSDLDMLFIVPNREMEREISSAVGSVERISPRGIHEVTLTNGEFTSLLREKRPNVAWEALESRIVLYGAEALFKTLEAVL